MKKCALCREEKDESCFYNNKRQKDGLSSECKRCDKDRSRIYYRNNRERLKLKAKEWRKDNIERKKENDSRWQKNNRDKRNKANRKYREKNKEKLKDNYIKNKTKYSERSKIYYRLNRDKIIQKNLEYQYATREARNERQRNRMKTDTHFRISTTMAKSLHNTLKTKKGGQKWESLVGYTTTDLMNHLEKQFTPEMTWENYGSYWHIDHLVPKYYFDYDSYDHPHFSACWSLSNLQPLEAKKNLRKNRYVIQL